MNVRPAWLRLVVSVSLVILGGLVLSAGWGCNKRVTLADKAIREGVLLIGGGSEPQTLDPHINRGVPESKIIFSLLEGLVTYHATDDSRVEPGMAERWETSPDGKVWTFYLRNNARWSNGDAVTASDFVYSWQRVLMPALACEYAEWLYVIEGAEDFNRGKLKDFKQVGVHARDDKTLEVHLRAPTPEFLFMLQLHTFLPVHRGTIEKYGNMTDRTGQWTRPGNTVGNGPFTLAEWTVNQRIRVVKNPLYWDADKVALNEIHFFPIENVDTEEKSFAAGQLHITNTLPIPKIDSWQGMAAESIRFDDFLGIYYYSLNTRKPPLSDPRVREALSLAVDREALVSKVTRGRQRPATSFTPDLVPDYGPLRLLQFNPERARQLLAEAGYPGGKGFPKLRLLYNSNDNHRIIAEAMQYMFQQHLGVQLELTNQEWRVYLNSLQSGDYDIARAGWVGNRFPLSFLQNFLKESGNNYTGWSSVQYEQLIEEARLNGSLAQRNLLLSRAEEMMMVQHPIIPLYFYTNIYLIDPRVQGWKPSLTDFRSYKHISFKKP
ncbi:MAG: peptide ABC transporter substrate-binding protein [Verrucomicrobiota bacterium]|nr:peptide ABC transporter substrate-binding protein [Verrucomicrobiota bacterium]